MQGSFLLLQFFDCFRDPFFSQWIEPLLQKFSVVRDLVLKNEAFFAHRSPPYDQPGAQHSLSPMDAEGRAMINKTPPAMFGSRH